MTKKSKLNLYDIANLYCKENLTSAEIARKFSCGETLVLRKLKEANVQVIPGKKPIGFKAVNKIDFSIEQQCDILKRYDKWESISEIANQYNCSVRPIYRILKEKGIVCNHTPRRYFFNEDYFEQINTANKAYWLGLLYADGNVSNRLLQIGLHRKDRYILELFAKDVDYKGKIRDLEEVRTFKDKAKTYYSSRLTLYSKKFVQHLYHKGMFPNKTFRLKFPIFLNNDYYVHFIRGVFDGDGFITMYNERNGRLGFSFGIVGQKELLISISDFIQEHLGIISNIREHGKHCWSFSHGAFNNVMKIKKWLYQDADRFFVRKKHRFDLIEKRYDGKES